MFLKGTQQGLRAGWLMLIVVGSAGADEGFVGPSPPPPHLLSHGTLCPQVQPQAGVR